MSYRNWKHPPQSLQEAMEACLDHALKKHRRSLDHVAADMGLPNKWVLYKWVESGRMPAVMIRPFELACRAAFVTAFIGHSAHKLVIDIPTGRMPEAHDLAVVQAVAHDAVGALIDFTAGKVDAAFVQTTMTVAMEQLAWHRENAARAAQPELDLEVVHG